MVLVDTSIWVDHLNKRNAELQFLLNESVVLTHPFIIGELACGNLKKRQLILGLIKALPGVKTISEGEYYTFIERNKLFGKGLGFVDIHLLASAAISNVAVFSRDKALITASVQLGLNYR